MRSSFPFSFSVEGGTFEGSRTFLAADSARAIDHVNIFPSAIYLALRSLTLFCCASRSSSSGVGPGSKSKAGAGVGGSLNPGFFLKASMFFISFPKTPSRGSFKATALYTVLSTFGFSNS